VQQTALEALKYVKDEITEDSARANSSDIQEIFATAKRVAENLSIMHPNEPKVKEASDLLAQLKKSNIPEPKGQRPMELNSENLTKDGKVSDGFQKQFTETLKSIGDLFDQISVPNFKARRKAREEARGEVTGGAHRSLNTDDWKQIEELTKKKMEEKEPEIAEQRKEALGKLQWALHERYNSDGSGVKNENVLNAIEESIQACSYGELNDSELKFLMAAFETKSEADTP
jgi:hypothetical protein